MLHLLLMWLGFALLMHRPFHSSGMDILPLDGERPLLFFSPAFAALAFYFGPVRVAFSCFLAFMYIFMTRFISGMVGFSMRLHSVSMSLSWTPVSMRNIMCSSKRHEVDVTQLGAGLEQLDEGLHRLPSPRVLLHFPEL